MQNIYFSGPVMWAQVDANRHLRHSAYADFGAQARLELLEKVGLPATEFERLLIGPILFREELVYLREVHLNDTLSVSCELIKSRADHSRWSIRHEIFRKDAVKAAVVTVDGAWIDLKIRKLTSLPENLIQKFNSIPKSVDYVEEIVNGKS